MAKRLLFSLYAIVPAIAFFLPVRNDEISWLWLIILVPINYVFFAFPLLLWLLIVHLNKLGSPLLHAGLIGVTLSLIALIIAFEFYFNNDNSMGWIIYYPLATVTCSIFTVIAYAFSPDDGPSA